MIFYYDVHVWLRKYIQGALICFLFGWLAVSLEFALFMWAVWSLAIWIVTVLELHIQPYFKRKPERRVLKDGKEESSKEDLLEGRRPSKDNEKVL